MAVPIWLKLQNKNVGQYSWKMLWSVGLLVVTMAAPATLANETPANTHDSPVPFGCRRCVRPDYPDAALSAEIEGNPRVDFEVNRHGDVIYAQVVRSSGSAELDWAALEAVIRSKFTADGHGRTRTIEIDFSIEGSERNRAARRRTVPNSDDASAPAESSSSSPDASDSTAMPPVAEENTELDALTEDSPDRVLENVAVLFRVNTDGNVVTAVVTQSSGNSTLDQKVLQTVKQTIWTSEDLVRLRRLEAGLPFYPAPEPTVINDERQPVIQFEVDEDGNVIDARIIESSGDPALDGEALDAVRKTNFPAEGSRRRGVELIEIP